MSAFPQPGGESEVKPALYLVEEETEAIPYGAADYHRWALGQIAVGECDRAEDNLRIALCNLTSADPRRVQYWFDRATMREERGHFYYAAGDLQLVMDFLAEHEIDGAEEYMATAVTGLNRLDQVLECLAYTWPGQYGIPPESGRYLGFEQVADEVS